MQTSPQNLHALDAAQAEQSTFARHDALSAATSSVTNVAGVGIGIVTNLERIGTGVNTVVGGCPCCVGFVRDMSATHVPVAPVIEYIGAHEQTGDVGVVARHCTALGAPRCAQVLSNTQKFSGLN